MSLASLRLLQLCSANLPTGAYAFSQGLETATEETWLTNFEDTRVWLEIQLRYSLGYADLPLLIRMLRAIYQGDFKKVLEWNLMTLALRETKEFRLNDLATGQALMRVLKRLENDDKTEQLERLFEQDSEISFVTAFSIAVHRWDITQYDACLGYAWSWLENQVSAATKLVPLGQTQSQQLLEKLQPEILNTIGLALDCEDDELGASLPILSIASCWHEHQYSRLFRS